MKGKIVSAAYILYCLIDITIAILSNFILIHMVMLGAVCLAAGIGLWLKKAWSIYLVTVSGVLTFTVGTITLYSSMRLAGFAQSGQTLGVDLALIGYIVAALGLFIYTIINRSTMLDLES